MNEKKYNSIDIVKFIAALLVIMIHIPLVDDSHNIIFYYFKLFTSHSISRIAVPFFFICSGFFLYKKTVNVFSLKPSKKYLKRILFLYLFWSLIYLISDIKELINDPASLLTHIQKFILVTDTRYLWYLHGLIIAVVLTSLLLYLKVKPRKILFISSLFYIVGLLGSSYYGILFKNIEEFILIKWYYNVFESTRNGLFFGFFFVSLGMNIAYKDINLSKNKTTIFLVISLILLLFETFMISYFEISNMYDIQIFLIPTTLFMFLLVKNIDVKDGVIVNNLRSISTLMYLSHMLINKTISWTDIYKLPVIYNTPIRYLVVSVLTILFSILIVKLSNINKLSWLNKIY